ncbi:MAG: flagellar biosynthesis protein FlhB [Rhodospirillales bacterium]|jgi:flagellar biosynthetic protein FlhB|nr:flagellar biosynthesis protein FlhB [Rhodospirillales bacterium]
MAEEDDSQKTEEPTPKKIEKARSKGQVATSQEIKSWLILLAGAMALYVMAPSMMGDIRQIGRTLLETSHAIPMDAPHLRLLLADVLLKVGIIVAPLAVLLLVVSVAASVGQSGLLVAPSKIKLETSKISLVKGFKNKFSLRQFIEFVKGIVKLSVVAIVAAGLAVPMLDGITLAPMTDIVWTLQRLHRIALWIVAGTVAVMTAIALLDYAYQKYNYIKQLRMTKQEVKDENKQAEGDPQIKAQIRRIRAQRARQRMMAAVPNADVVITNPTHFAVALQYKMDEMAAPKVVAKGVDTLALRIRQVAEENDVPIVENPPLARALHAAVELDEEIPPEHFKAVAEVIGYVMRLRGRLPSATAG